MPAKPWVTFRRPDPDREYIALLSELPLKRFRDLGEFLLYAWQIQHQLRSAPGLVGYSLKARILKKRFWTLSVWEAETDLHQFVGQAPQQQGHDGSWRQDGTDPFPAVEHPGLPVSPELARSFRATSRGRPCLLVLRGQPSGGREAHRRTRCVHLRPLHPQARGQAPGERPAVLSRPINLARGVRAIQRLQSVPVFPASQEPLGWARRVFLLFPALDRAHRCSC